MALVAYCTVYGADCMLFCASHAAPRSRAARAGLRASAVRTLHGLRSRRRPLTIRVMRLRSVQPRRLRAPDSGTRRRAFVFAARVDMPCSDAARCALTPRPQSSSRRRGGGSGSCLRARAHRFFPCTSTGARRRSRATNTAPEEAGAHDRPGRAHASRCYAARDSAAANVSSASTASKVPATWVAVTSSCEQLSHATLALRSLRPRPSLPRSSSIRAWRSPR